MNCSCIQDTERRLADHFRPEAGENTRATCGQIGIDFGSGNLALTIPFTVRGSARKFNTVKGYPASMVAKFCPFCGRDTKRYVVGEDAGIAAACGGAV